MNLLKKIEKEGYYRIFEHQWNSDMRDRVRRVLKTGEVEFIELPFHWGHLRYLYLKNGPESDITTVMFKIPIDFIPYKELWSKWGKRRKKKLGEFLIAWVLKKRVDDEALKNCHASYAFRYAITSVPRFLSPRLFAYLNAFGIVYKEVSPEYHHINCQNCGYGFRFRSNTAIKRSNCPQCNAVSFVR